MAQLPLTLVKYLQLLKTLEEHGLSSKRLQDTADRLWATGGPLVRFSQGTALRGEERGTTPRLRFPDGGARLLIQPIRFWGPNESGHAGLELRGYGGTMRLNTLKNFQASLTRLWRLRDYTPGQPVWSQSGTVVIDPKVREVFVTDDNDPEYGTWAGDLGFGAVRDSRTGEFGMLMKEGWDGGTVLLLTNLDLFLSKLREASVLADYAVAHPEK